MGKGDKKTKRGKINRGTFGVRRPRKKSKPIVVVAKPKKKTVAKPKAKPKAATKPKAVTKPKAASKPKAATKKPVAKKPVKKSTKKE